MCNLSQRLLPNKMDCHQRVLAFLQEFCSGCSPRYIMTAVTQPSAGKEDLGWAWLQKQCSFGH